MKLEELLGADLYAQVQAKLDEVNGKEPDKLKHIRYADLSEGEYVSKAKHDALEQQLQGKITELTGANDLIAQLKKASEGNEDLQTKITTYEAENTKLQEQLEETKLKSAIKVALLQEKAVDVDYLTFKLNEKLKEKGETLELDENDNIKGWETQLTGLKTQFPTMFGSGEKGDDYKALGGDPLPNPNFNKTVTKEQFNAMGVEERTKLKQENEKLYYSLKN